MMLLVSTTPSIHEGQLGRAAQSNRRTGAGRVSMEDGTEKQWDRDRARLHGRTAVGPFRRLGHTAQRSSGTGTGCVSMEDGTEKQWDRNWARLPLHGWAARFGGWATQHREAVGPGQDDGAVVAPCRVNPAEVPGPAARSPAGYGASARNGRYGNSPLTPAGRLPAVGRAAQPSAQKRRKHRQRAAAGSYRRQCLYLHAGRAGIDQARLKHSHNRLPPHRSSGRSLVSIQKTVTTSMCIFTDVT